MSTGDSRRSPQKSTNAAATGGKDTDATSGEPVGGVLPVKKARPGAQSSTRTGSGSSGSGSSGSGSAAGRAAGSSTSRTAGSGSGGNGSSANRAGGSRPGAKVTPAAKSTPVAKGKVAPAKAAPVDDDLDDLDDLDDELAADDELDLDDDTEDEAPRRPARSVGAGKVAAKATPAKTSSGKTTSGKTSGLRNGAAAKRGVTETLDSRKGKGSSASVFGGGSKNGTRPGAGARPGAGRPAGKATGRKTLAPVRVAEKRNWGPILMFIGAGVVAVLIIGYGAWPMIKDSFQYGINTSGWRDQARGIPDIIDYWDEDSPNYDASVHNQNHVAGDQTYPMTPPVGGNHNQYWQNCMGDIYTEPIADEHAVHSLEHGTVWITYNPDLLAQDQIDKLADKVRGLEYSMLSPYPGLDRAISVQAWGYQLKVDGADDARIDDFMRILRNNAALEPGASCSNGITDPSPTPFDFSGGM